MKTLELLESMTKSKSNPSGISKSANAYKMVKNAIETGKIIRPNYHQGTGRFGSTNENKMQVESLLRKMGIDFTSGNDAPKGGKTGEWIMLKF